MAKILLCENLFLVPASLKNIMRENVFRGAQKVQNAFFKTRDRELFSSAKPKNKKFEITFAENRDPRIAFFKTRESILNSWVRRFLNHAQKHLRTSRTVQTTKWLLLVRKTFFRERNFQPFFCNKLQCNPITNRERLTRLTLSRKSQRIWPAIAIYCLQRYEKQAYTARLSTRSNWIKLQARKSTSCFCVTTPLQIERH